MRRWTRNVAIGALVMMGATLPPLPVALAESSPPGSVYVIQGVQGEDVAVSVDGKRQAASMATKDILGPWQLSPGRHEVAFTGSDWSTSATVKIASGQSIDVVVHRPAALGDEPVVTTYRNPTRAVTGGQGRVMVAHAAVVPPADITVNGDVLFANVANGEFATADVPAGTYSVAIVPTGTSADPLLGPVDLAVAGETLTQVFAIGRPQNGSMDVIVQQLPLGTRGSAPPTSVDTGSAGLASGLGAPESTSDQAVWPSASRAVVAFLLLMAATVMWRLTGRPARRGGARRSRA